MYLTEVVDEIRDRLTQQRLSGRKLLWATIIKQIAKQDSLDSNCADTLLEVIREFLKPLGDKTILSLWRETETGMGDEAEDDFLLADCCRMDLEMEILQQTTDLAWQEANQLNKATVNKRKAKQKGGRKKKRTDER